jgi:virulence-associated protein VapD
MLGPHLQRGGSTTQVGTYHMSKWAIVYDLNSQLIIGELGNSGNTQYYNKVRKCLSRNHFSMFLQQSVYVAEGSTSLVDAISACNELRKLHDSARYINRIHLFKIEEVSDLRPIIVDGRRTRQRRNLDRPAAQRKLPPSASARGTRPDRRTGTRGSRRASSRRKSA